MRKAREILRLKHEAGLTNRQIGSSLRMSHVSVGKYLKQAAEAGLGWPLPEGLAEGELAGRLKSSQPPPEKAGRILPDMAVIDREMRRKGVTLYLLWEEYRREHPEGYGYTQFCEYYSRYRSQQEEPCLRQVHKGGEKLFVDWAGDTIRYVDAETGEEREASLFIGALGASNYTFARAFENRKQPNWIEGHIGCWEYLGGVATLTIPDNEKTGVDRACRYEPGVNRVYQDLADHYGTVIIPARPRTPQDKAKVENAVLNAERRIMAVLRDRTFIGLEELNAAIAVALKALNDRPFQKWPGCRSSLFEELDKPALKPLPAIRFEMAEWREAKVNIDYHVQVDWHLYSVPYHLVNQTVEVRLTARCVELYWQGKRVAAHARTTQRGGATTEASHRPKSHQQHLEWSPSRLIQWAENEVGESGGKVAAIILETQPHPESGYRQCLGLMRLGRHHGKQRLEHACGRALQTETCSYQSIKSMLETGADRCPLPSTSQAAPAVIHPNLRGANYYR